jgi:uncharacterized Zn finger protein
VRVLGRSSTDMVAEVTSGEKVYQVCITGPEATCTCPWYRNHGSSRGPCKHVLAVRLENGRA